jgi:hypothetical protein
MRGRFSSFIGWLVFFRTVTWFVRVRYAVDRSGVVLTKPYCKRTRFIPDFPNSSSDETSRWSFVLLTKPHYFKYKPPARPAAKRAWPWYLPMQHYAKSDIASRI